MHSLRAFTCLLSTAVLLAACGASSPGSNPTPTDASAVDATNPRDAATVDAPGDDAEDAAIDKEPVEDVQVEDAAVDDAEPEDAGPEDAGPARSPLFGRCSGAGTCEDLPNATCLSDWVGGMCSRTCTRDAECGPNGMCAGGRFCFLRCRPGANDCARVNGLCITFGASGYACNPSCTLPAPAGTPACVPGYRCDAWNNACLRTVHTGADNGEPCTDRSQCRSGLCTTEVDAAGRPTGNLGGICVSVGRRPADRDYGARLPRGSCPVGSVALSLDGAREGDAAFCMRECTADVDCRSGYHCAHQVNGDPRTYANGFCAPLQCGSGQTCPAGYSCTRTTRSDGVAVQVCARCVPTCTGRACGPDGCGGTCGACPSTQTCDAGGRCVCTPSCAGRTCGPDGCGGTCGACPSTQTCASTGRCVCTPNCAGRTCGADGCGGTCGACATGMTCTAAGTCGACVPSCAGRTCGPNGCGGACGTCATGMECGPTGTCRVPPCDPVRLTGCPSGQHCVVARTGAPSCIADGGTTPFGYPCTGSADCARGTFCATIGFDQLCRRTCRADADCPSGQCAIALSGTTEFRVCTTTCDPTSTSSCSAGNSCFVFDTDSVREATDCLPTGSGSTGVSCSTPDGCSGGYSCVARTCRRVCASGESCATGACAGVTGWSQYGVCPR